MIQDRIFGSFVAVMLVVTIYILWDVALKLDYLAVAMTSVMTCLVGFMLFDIWRSVWRKR